MNSNVITRYLYTYMKRFIDKVLESENEDVDVEEIVDVNLHRPQVFANLG